MTSFGRIIFCFLCIGFGSIEALSLSLRVIDENKQAIRVVDCVNPFIVEVTVDEDVTERPLIASLEKLEVLEEKTSTTVTFINGAKHFTKHFMYEVRAIRPGHLTIGPALLKGIQSNVVHLNVQEKSTVAQKEQFFLNIVIPKNKVFVGEKVPYTIRFLYPPRMKNKLQLNGIDQPYHKDLEVLEAEGPQFGSYQKNGEYYNAYEWQGSFIAQRSGSLTLPPLKAYIEEMDSNNFFAAFLGGKRRTIVSEPLTLLVEDLPPFPEKVEAIGEFETFTLQLEKNSVRQHEGISALLTLGGLGNFEKINPPVLQLPEVFKGYPSANSFNHAKGIDYKRFEYIIQPLQSGILEIPGQKFVYFSPREKIYKTLFTNPITIAVLPSSPSSALSPEEVQQSPAESEAKEESETSILPTISSWRMLAVPWIYFIVLWLVPTLLITAWYSSSLVVRVYHRYPSIRVRFLLKQARQKIARAPRQWYALYSIFNDLFQHLQALNPQYETYMNTLVENMDDVQKKEWQIYWQEVVKQSFSTESNNQHLDEYYKQAQKRWLPLFTSLILKKPYEK